jgi:hypothetical protein
MTNGFNGIITHLERQKTAIDKALAALRDIGVSAAGPAETATAEEPLASPTRKGGMSPEGKQRLIAALKKRWADKKRAAKKTAAEPAKAGPSTGRITEEGRRRLAEAMKRRWAVKRAGSALKKSTHKKAA